MSKWALRALVVLVFASPLLAQPLADRVPAEATSYLGWKGADALKAQYAGSHLQGVVDASDLPAVFDRTWPSVLRRIRQEDADAADRLDQAGRIMRIAARHPSACFVIVGPDLQSVRPAVLIQAGADAEALAGQIRQAVPADRQTAIATIDGIVAVFFAHDGADRPRLAGGDVPSLKSVPSFQHAVAQVQAAGAVTLYLDVAALRERIDAIADAVGSDAEALALSRAAGGLLRGIDAIAYSAAFEGKQWRTDTFIAAASPRSGMATLLDAAPASDELLSAIPVEADWMVLRRLDVDKLYTLARSTAESAGPDALKAFDQVVGVTTLALGINLQQSLLEPLGDEWAVYTAPRSVGVGYFGAVAINRTDDPAKVNRGLSSIAIAATNFFSNAMRRQNLSMQLRTTTHNGTRISYLPTPVVSPAWAIKGKLLFVGFYPQTVAAALDAAAAEGSILDNPTYQAVRQQLPRQDATSISFANLPETAPQVYPMLLMVGQTYMGFADLAGAEGRPMLLPTLAKLRPHLTPAGRVAWVDDAGWHARTIGPFPGSDMLAGEASVLVAQYPAVIALTVPALVRARQAAEQVAQLSNVRQIGLAIHMHVNANGGRLPADLAELTRSEYLPASVFVPTGTTVPVEVLTGTPEARAAWVMQHTNLVYLRPAEKMREIHQPQQVILVHENPAGAKPGRKLAAVFADGHAESLSLEQLNERLQKQGAAQPGS